MAMSMGMFPECNQIEEYTCVNIYGVISKVPRPGVNVGLWFDSYQPSRVSLLHASPTTVVPLALSSISELLITSVP